MNTRHFLFRLTAHVPMPAFAGSLLAHLHGKHTKVLPAEQMDLPFDWFTLPRIPVRSAESELARTINDAIAHGRILRFRYHSGTTRGAVRKVLPSLLFRLEGYPHLYLSAWCAARAAQRTFRLDRCEDIKVV